VAYSSLRITFGEDNTKEDVDYLLEKLEEIVRRLRKIATGSGFKWQ
jgi:cysteine desulfurase